MKRRNLMIGAGVVGGATALGAGGYVAVAHSTYSHGWRMGRLDKLSLRSSWRRLYVVSTGEGDLMLGFGSSTAAWAGADGQSVTNPWSFSCTSEAADRYRALLGQQVAVHYRQLMSPMTSFGGDTDYRADDIVPLDPNIATGVCVAEGRGLRSAGDRVGRVVKITTKGRMAKSYEATLQVGASGNQFIEMSILNDAMAQCATSYLRSGRLAVVSYRESAIRNPLMRDTNYDIIGLRPAG